MNGRSTAAIMAMSASTHTISSKVKPRSESSLILGIGHVVERNVGSNTAAAFLTIRSIRHDIVRSAFSGRAIQIGMAPGIVRHVAALEIRPVPCSDARRTLYQRRQAFRRRGKAASVEIKQI